jgi:hypothetical protein|tara:strand:+ start:126 stop:845 length:720 start_codon:yes stop_codon:yes gene_type:complete
MVSTNKSIKYNLDEKVFELAQGNIVTHDSKSIVVPYKTYFHYDEGFSGVLDTIFNASGDQPFSDAREKAEEIAYEHGYVKYPGMKEKGLIYPYNGVIVSGEYLNNKSLIFIVSNDFTGNRKPENPDKVYIDNDDGSYIDAKSIRETVKSALSLADKHNLRLADKNYRRLSSERIFDSVVFSAMGTNQYKVPLDVSVRNIVETIKDNIQEQKSLKKVSLIFYSENKYLQAMETVKSIMEK